MDNPLDKVNFGDGRSRVLILGNGVSRKKYLYIQQNWKGPIYGCNWIFKELINGTLPRLDILIGDRNALKEASQYQKQYGFKMIGKHKKSFVLPGVEEPKTPSPLISDSGSTIVIHALMEDYDEIWLCGFDLGGRDIYVKNHDKRNKYRWIEKWRKIAKIFGLSKIHFIGVNHQPFILSKMSADTYAKAYLRGQNHLEEIEISTVKNFNEEEYKAQLQKQENRKRYNQVLILGNGTSRTRSIERRFIQNWKKEIWVCNKAFVEYKKLKNITRIGTRYFPVAKNAERIFKDYDKDINIYVDFFNIREKDRFKLFNDNRGFATGNQLILQALQEEYDIWLCGFDFGGDSIYKDRACDGRRYRNEFLQIKDEFGLEKVRFVNQEVPKFAKQNSWYYNLKLIENEI